MPVLFSGGFLRGKPRVTFDSGLAISDEMLAGTTENTRADAEYVKEEKLSG